MYFLTYGLRKTLLDKSLKSPVSEDPSISNMVNEPQHCSKVDDRTFTILFAFIEHSSGWKCLSEWYAKS